MTTVFFESECINASIDMHRGNGNYLGGITLVLIIVSPWMQYHKTDKVLKGYYIKVLSGGTYQKDISKCGDASFYHI